MFSCVSPEQLARNHTHTSTTDPDARLLLKGKEPKPCFVGHMITENRNGPVVVSLDFESQTCSEIRIRAGKRRSSAAC